MVWRVELTARTMKQQRKLPQRVREVLFQISKLPGQCVATGPIIRSWRRVNITAI